MVSWSLQRASDEFKNHMTILWEFVSKWNDVEEVQWDTATMSNLSMVTITSAQIAECIATYFGKWMSELPSLSPSILYIPLWFKLFKNESLTLILIVPKGGRNHETLRWTRGEWGIVMTFHESGWYLRLTGLHFPRPLWLIKWNDT